MSSVVGLKPEALSRVQFSCYYGHVDDLVSGPNQTKKGKPVANPILLVRVFVSQVSALLRDPALQRRGLEHARKNNPSPCHRGSSFCVGRVSLLIKQRVAGVRGFPMSRWDGFQYLKCEEHQLKQKRCLRHRMERSESRVATRRCDQRTLDPGIRQVPEIRWTPERKSSRRPQSTGLCRTRF